MTATEFAAIKQYIILKGDRQTYCNRHNDNPHLTFGTYHVYLSPSIGQFLSNCDSNASDMDTLVIQDQFSLPRYLNIKLDNNSQMLIFDPPQSKTYFDQLYLFVEENKN